MGESGSVISIGYTVVIIYLQLKIITIGASLSTSTSDSILFALLPDAGIDTDSSDAVLSRIVSNRTSSGVDSDSSGILSQGLTQTERIIMRLYVHACVCVLIINIFWGEGGW